ncbi:MAG: DNA repair exonuclease [Coriobacteriia bacterium]|nr:DNA repair exonuclease [Coriobacteriia bacterium]
MSARVRFVHAADLHLGAPFAGVSAEDERVRRALVDAPYRALDAIVELCLGERVDFLVLAGDVYNAAERGVRPQLALADAAQALAEAGIRVFITHGNHDPARGGQTVARLPDTVHVFAHDSVERVVFERDGEPVCALYGRSFGRRDVSENLAAGFRRDPADEIAVAVLHANVGGRQGYDDYAPCTVGDLAAAGMDYWALGHIHEPGIVAETPLAVYAGAPQGMDPTQTGQRGCYLVTVERGAARAEFVPLASVVWESCTADVSGLVTLDEVEDRLELLCRDAAGAWSRPVVIRVDLMGRSEVHGVLGKPGALTALVERVRARTVSGEPWVWLDRVRDATAAPVDLDAIRAGSDLSADIVAIADELASDRDAVARELENALDPLLAKLRAAGVDASLDGIETSVVERARDIVLDALLAREA